MSGPRLDGRVVIVDDHASFATAMEIALQEHGFHASCADLPADADSSALVASIVDDPPDVLLLDLDLGACGDGRPLIAPAARAGVDVVVVTESEEDSDRARAIDAGAQAVLTKACPLADLLDTVRRALEGETLMSAQDRDVLLTRWSRHRSGHERAWTRFDQLTMRESAILDLLIAERPVWWIAVHLAVTDDALGAELDGILDKLGVSSSAAAVGLAQQVAWREPFDS
jgi:two-component system, NarL family, nitrate/nitrite response regulator NarL